MHAEYLKVCRMPSSLEGGYQRSTGTCGLHVRVKYGVRRNDYICRSNITEDSTCKIYCKFYKYFSKMKYQHKVKEKWTEFNWAKITHEKTFACLLLSCRYVILHSCVTYLEKILHWKGFDSQTYGVVSKGTRVSHWGTTTANLWIWNFHETVRSV